MGVAVGNGVGVAGRGAGVSVGTGVSVGGTGVGVGGTGVSVGGPGVTVGHGVSVGHWPPTETGRSAAITSKITVSKVARLRKRIASLPSTSSMNGLLLPLV